MDSLSSFYSKIASKEPKQEAFFAWKMEESPFFLREKRNLTEISDLKNELVFLGTNKRPDSMEEDLQILIGLKNSLQSQAVYPGSKLYLYYEDQPTTRGKLAFSSKRTPFEIRPFLIGPRSIRVETSVELPGITSNEMMSEKSEIILEEPIEKEMLFFEKTFYQTQAFQSLEKAKWLGVDRLFAVFGGEQYQKIKTLQRLEIMYEKNREIFFLNPGDVILWKNHKWIRIQEKEKAMGFPVAVVHAVYPTHMEIMLWDETGFHQHCFTYTIEENPSQLLSQNNFSKIKQRTHDSISLMLDKTRLILKKGDWVIKSEKGWRVLQTFEEIEKVLSYQAKGILFIFEGIERRGSKSFVQGSLFNHKRTMYQKIQLPISALKKKKKVKKIHISSSKSEDLDSNYLELETNDQRLLNQIKKYE